MQRIALITPFFDASLASGGALLSIDLARAWLARGDELLVLAGQRSRELRDLAEPLQAGRLHIVEVAPAEAERFTHRYDEALHRRAAAALGEFGPDVIHVHNFHGLLGAVWAAVGYDSAPTILLALDFGLLCPSFYLYDGTMTPCVGPESTAKCQACLRRNAPDAAAARGLKWSLPRWLTRRLWRRYARLDHHRGMAEIRERTLGLLGRFDAIIAPSSIMRERLCGYGAPADRVHEIVYGVDPSKVRRPAKTPSPVVRLGYMGSAEPVKGFAVVGAAAAELPDGLPLRITAYGGDSLGNAVAALPVAAKRYVKYGGQLAGEQVGAAHAEIDALLVPSLWHENSPFVVLESLANGTPVIEADQAGIRHLIGHDAVGASSGRAGGASLVARQEVGAGWLVPPGEPNAWRGAFERAASAPQELRQMADACRFDRHTCDFVEDQDALIATLREKGDILLFPMS